jgi:hypothetical protein
VALPQFENAAAVADGIGGICAVPTVATGRGFTGGFRQAAAGVVAFDIRQHVLPVVVVEDECSPAAFAPDRALMGGLAMDRFGGLVREPFGGVVDVAAGVWQRQMRVRLFDGECVDDQSAVGLCDAIAKRSSQAADHDPRSSPGSQRPYADLTRW